MVTKTFEKPVRGIDQLSDEISLKEGTVRSALNVLFDKDGNFNMRPGYTLRVGGAGYHSFYSSKRGWLIVCAKNVINRFDPETFGLTPLVDMIGSNLTSFVDFNGNLYYVSITDTGVFKEGYMNANFLGVELPALQPQFTASSEGSLFPGVYGVTYTLIAPDGEESGTGPLITIDLPNGGGITGMLFTILSEYKYRIYMTTANGEELYQAAEFDANVVSYNIGSHEQGRQATTRNLKPMPTGYTIRSLGSRLFVAAKDYVYFSDAFRPHLYNPAKNFIKINGFPYMMEMLDTGMFVSDKTGVKFYQGTDPTTFTVIQASTEQAIFGTSVIVPKEYLSKDFENYARVVIWLTSSGYQVGLPSGEVVALHKDQVKLPQYTQGSTAAFTLDGKRQIITPVNSNLLEGSSIAVDSTIT